MLARSERGNAMPCKGQNKPAQGQRPGFSNQAATHALKGQNRGRSVAQSLSKNLIHLIYSTKHREPCLTSDIRPGLYAYKAGILKRWGSPALIIGGAADHVHLLFCLSKNHALKTIVEEVKKGSFQVAQNIEGKSPWISLAKRLRCLLCESVQCRSGQAIC
jgi:REP element-mobilizing transposase RayT